MRSIVPYLPIAHKAPPGTTCTAKNTAQPPSSARWAVRKLNLDPVPKLSWDQETTFNLRADTGFFLEKYVVTTIERIDADGYNFRLYREESNNGFGNKPAVLVTEPVASLFGQPCRPEEDHNL